MFKNEGGRGGQRLFEQCSKKTDDLVREGVPKRGVITISAQILFTLTWTCSICFIDVVADVCREYSALESVDIFPDITLVPPSVAS